MKSKATTVEQYLAELPEDRRHALSEVRSEILKRLPDGYVESIGFGMIVYIVPLAVYPDTYNKQPLMYAALASQKNHMAVYLSAIYASEEKRAEFEAAYAQSGKRYDCGKSCVRFRKLEDLPIDVIGDAVASMSMDEFVAIAKAARGG